MNLFQRFAVYLAQIAVPFRKKYKAVTTATTLSRRDTGAHVTNLGASGSVTVTLPQDAQAGDHFTFLRVATQTFRIDPGAAGAIYCLISSTWAKQTDNKYIEADGDGDAITLVANGAGDWEAVAQTGGWAVEG